MLESEAGRTPGVGNLGEYDAYTRTLLESLPDALVILGPDGRISAVNTQTQKLFGYAREQLVGQKVEILLPERLRSRHEHHRADYWSDPRVRPMGAGLELFGRRQDGSEFPVEISLSPVRTSDGLVVISAIRDVTERKRFERALQEKNEELERAIQAKDRFLASMSHELRTPLNAVLGFTGTLLMRLPGPLTSEQQKQLETIRTSARHLLSLINDLLDLAKIESGRVEMVLEPVPCHEVVLEVAGSLRPSAEARRLDLQATVPPEGLTVRTDRRALSQILLNLANNAIKFTEQGQVRVELQPLGSHGAAFHVTDSGTGISPEDQEKLFEPFRQLGRSRREGTGLGLHLSRKLAELLGGRIEFESEPGRGSRFSLLLGDGT